MISPRCVAPVCCGVGLAAGVLAQRVFGRSLRAGMAVVVLMVVWVGVREGACAGVLFAQRREFGNHGDGRIHAARTIARRAVATSTLVTGTPSSMVRPLQQRRGTALHHVDPIAQRRPGRHLRILSLRFNVKQIRVKRWHWYHSVSSPRLGRCRTSSGSARTPTRTSQCRQIAPNR